MSKKISFKRPDKPVPREADDWVVASEETPTPGTSAKPKPETKTKTKTKPATARKAPPPRTGPQSSRDRDPRPTPARSVSLSDVRWVDHMLASVDRQSDMVLRRAAALPLEIGDGEAAASLLAGMDARAQAVIDRMKALQSKIRPAAGPSPAKQ